MRSCCSQPAPGKQATGRGALWDRSAQTSDQPSTIKTSDTKVASLRRARNGSVAETVLVGAGSELAVWLSRSTG